MELTELVVDAPDGWFVLDPDPATRAATAKADVAARAEQITGASGYEDEMVEGLLRFAADADEKGALFGAVRWDPGLTGPTVASVLVLVGKRRHPADPAEEIGSLLDRLARPEPTDWGAREVSAIDLPIGPAVRLRFLAQMPGPDTEPGILDATQIWVPLPDDGSEDDGQMLMVSASTAALHAGDDTAAVAERMARSLRVSSRE